MTTAQLKNLLVKKINKIDDEDLLNAINVVLEKGGSGDEIYKLNPIQKKLIEKSDKEFREGKTISNEDVFREIDEWLKEK
jgi:hypothetical protein